MQLPCVLDFVGLQSFKAFQVQARTPFDGLVFHLTDKRLGPQAPAPAHPLRHHFLLLRVIRTQEFKIAAVLLPAQLRVAQPTRLLQQVGRFQPCRAAFLGKPVQTAPAVPAQACLFLQTRAKRIEVDIVADLGKRMSRFNHQAFVTALKGPSGPTAIFVKAPDPSPLQPFHSFTQVRFSQLHGQMKMIAHDDVGMHPPAGFLRRFRQSPLKGFSRAFLLENHLPVISPVDHMVTTSPIFHSQRSCHHGRQGKVRLFVKSQDLTSFDSPPRLVPGNLARTQVFHRCKFARRKGLLLRLEGNDWRPPPLAMD